MKVALQNNYLNHLQVLLARLTNRQQYRDAVTRDVEFLINNQRRTPRGLLYIDRSGTLGLAANAALIMLQVNTHLFYQYM